MKRLTQLLCLAILWWTTGCSAWEPPSIETVPSATAPDSIPSPFPTPERAHEFRLHSLDGETIALQDVRGRWVILNFWATWCGPCRDEMPYLQQIADEYSPQVTVLGVNMREAPDEIRPFLEEVAVTFPILLHPDDEMLRWYSPRGLPLTYVIAPDGTVVHQQFGALAPETFDEWLAEHVQP